MIYYCEPVVEIKYYSVVCHDVVLEDWKIKKKRLHLATWIAVSYAMPMYL